MIVVGCTIVILVSLAVATWLVRRENDLLGQRYEVLYKEFVDHVAKTMLDERKRLVRETEAAVAKLNAASRALLRSGNYMRSEDVDTVAPAPETEESGP